MKPPNELTSLPRDGVVFSLKDLGVTELSGGDYDGDIVAFSVDKTLLQLMSIPIVSLFGDEALNWRTELQQKL